MGIMKDIIDNGKFRDYIALSSFECKMSLSFSILMISFLYYFNAYENFSVLSGCYSKLTLAIASSLVAFLGIIFAGIALLINTLKDDTFKKIEGINGSGNIRKIMSSFKFLVLNIGCAIFGYIGMFLLNYINIQPPKVLFYMVVFLFTYWLVFIVFYCIGLINNTIDIYFISNTYKDINNRERTIMDMANEIRIDFILHNVFLGQIEKSELLQRLDEFINNSECKEKETIRKYIDEYYQ